MRAAVSRISSRGGEKSSSPWQSGRDRPADGFPANENPAAYLIRFRIGVEIDIGNLLGPQLNIP